MITGSLHEKCGELFEAYPLAVDDDSMVLMTSDRKTAGFFLLGRKRDGYWLDQWRTEGTFDIDAETWDIPAWVTDSITRGVPLPRDGSLFGWKRGSGITALVMVHTQYAPEYPEPTFTVMLLAGLPEKSWPPFADAGLFGSWFWDHCRAGRIVSLATMIAGHRDTIFWVAPEDAQSGCVAVRTDVRSKAATLQQGVYAWTGALRSGKPVLSLDALLRDSSADDLGPRFRRMTEAGR